MPHTSIRVDLEKVASSARPHPLLQLGFVVLAAIRVKLASLDVRIVLSGSPESCWGCCARRGYGLVAAWCRRAFVVRLQRYCLQVPASRFLPLLFFFSYLWSYWPCFPLWDAGHVVLLLLC
jgi:hypothetical protein